MKVHLEAHLEVHLEVKKIQFDYFPKSATTQSMLSISCNYIRNCC